MENGSINTKLPIIRCQSHLCIKIAFKTEVSIPRIINAQTRVIELLPKTALPQLFSAAVQYADPKNGDEYGY